MLREVRAARKERSKKRPRVDRGLAQQKRRGAFKRTLRAKPAGLARGSDPTRVLFRGLSDTSLLKM